MTKILARPINDDYGTDLTQEKFQPMLEALKTVLDPITKENLLQMTTQLPMGGGGLSFRYANGTKDEWVHGIVRNDPGFISFLVQPDYNGKRTGDKNKVTFELSAIPNKSLVKPIQAKKGTVEEVTKYLVAKLPDYIKEVQKLGKGKQY